MNEQLMLISLKTDLGISTDAYDASLLRRLQVAQARITEEGVTLEDSENDRDLVVMYAGWLWRYRQTSEAMPRMLRYALNNRIFSVKARADA